MTTGYNTARQEALELGKAAFRAGVQRNCFADSKWLALWSAWSKKDLKRATRLGEQWYFGWDSTNAASAAA